MNTTTTETRGKEASPIVKITTNTIGMGHPRKWLLAGIEDYRRSPFLSFFYGVFWVLLSAAVTAFAIFMGYWHWLLPLVAGFMFIGPLVAVGSFGIRKSVTLGRRPGITDAFAGWKDHRGQLAMVGLMMLIFLLAWIRLATLLFALFFGLELPTPGELYASLLTTPNGISMVVAGIAAGGLMAFGAFTISVVAIPTVMDHNLTFMEGIEASIRSVTRNFQPMLLWGAMITACVAIGVVTFYVGLLFVLPVLGYASCHAYRDLVNIAHMLDEESQGKR